MNDDREQLPEDAGTPLDRFKDLLKNILSVPKKDIDEALDQERIERPATELDEREE